MGIRIESPSTLAAVEVRCSSREEAADWVTKLRETATTASIRDNESRRKERAMRIARELSNLVIYCRSVPWSSERVGEAAFAEMSSFPETKAERLMCGPTGDAALFLSYHRSQFSRIYPKVTPTYLHANLLPTYLLPTHLPRGNYYSVAGVVAT